MMVAETTVQPYSLGDADIVRLVRQSPSLLEALAHANARTTLGPACLKPEVVFDLMAKYGTQGVECLVVLVLDMQLHVRAELIMARGSDGRAHSSPLAIMQAVLSRQSSRFILVHNHPAGKLEPSYEDDEFTRVVLRAAQACNAQLLDHIIVTSQGFVSYACSGRLTLVGG